VPNSANKVYSNGCTPCPQRLSDHALQTAVKPSALAPGRASFMPRATGRYFPGSFDPFQLLQPMENP
jgi:hypothetical protein